MMTVHPLSPRVHDCVIIDETCPHSPRPLTRCRYCYQAQTNQASLMRVDSTTA
jgi:hypothetical protein